MILVTLSFHFFLVVLFSYCTFSWVDKVHLMLVDNEVSFRIRRAQTNKNSHFLSVLWWQPESCIVSPECHWKSHSVCERLKLSQHSEAEAFLLDSSSLPSWSIHCLPGLVLRSDLYQHHFCWQELVLTSGTYTHTQTNTVQINITESAHCLSALGLRTVSWIHEFLIPQSVGWSIIQFCLCASMSGSNLTCPSRSLLYTVCFMSLS